MARHPNSVGFKFPRRRKKGELPPSKWKYPPDVPLPHPEIAMGRHPSLINGEWVWPPSSEEETEQLPNAWQDWQREEE